MINTLKIQAVRATTAAVAGIVAIVHGKLIKINKAFRYTLC